MTVCEADTFEVLGEGRTDPGGRLKLLYPPQGAARIFAHSTNDPSGGVVPIGRQGMRHRYELDVEESAWSTSGEVVVQLDDEPICGQITVTNVPKGAPEIIASDPMQFEHTPTQILKDSYVFDDLPAGEYIVGPRKWVRALVAQGVYRSEGVGSPLIAMLNPNSKLEKAWRSDWFVQQPLTGRVIGNPKILNGAVLLARYGSARSRKIAGVQRVHMDALGHYEIPIGDPRPVGLTVVYGEGRPGLATFLPGKDCSIQTGSIRILIPEGAPAPEWMIFNTKHIALAADEREWRDALFISQP
ncbi:MAG: hypothetical protein P1V35_10725, partial [Planctomycetota bacterium]|nr:hypothetical protein [Planctomycetota bacterium]